jgi:hypothetical protein
MVEKKEQKVGKLPLSIQDFTEIREKGLCYVDKTSQIYQLITGNAKTFFLSRPRRFGKSLLCSTMESLFEGKRELFEAIAGRPALAICETDWEWEEYPVIKIDFSPGDYNQDSLLTLYSNITRSMDFCAEKYGVQVVGEVISDKLARLLHSLNKQCGRKVVVIIDEYDKPLLDTYDTPEKYELLRNALRGFYAVLKSYDQYLRFVFLTGITKFSKVNLFSNLNQLIDISLDHRYADICGFTEEELLSNYEPYIESVYNAQNISREEYLDKLRTFYNGYRFSERDLRVYNPFGLLLHFNNEGKFLAYWFATGSPTYLINLIKKQKLKILEISEQKVFFDVLYRYDVDNMNAEVILYQTGYLTISDYLEDENSFVLDYPNEEVRSSFMKSLISLYFDATESETQALIYQLPTYLKKGKIADGIKVLEQFLASIPYELIEKSENYYQTVVHIVFSMFGLSCRSEVHTSAGRIDALVETKDYVYCFEFKIDKTAKEALSQIDLKRYTLPYQEKGKQIYKIGVNFDSKIRNIGEWEIG